MSDKQSYSVKVPVKTFQSFSVSAETPMGAKRIVGRWLRGQRGEDDQLTVIDDIGQEVTYLGVESWEVLDDAG